MLIKAFRIGRLTIAIFDVWLGFENRNFGHLGKRKNFGFIKFWIDVKQEAT